MIFKTKKRIELYYEVKGDLKSDKVIAFFNGVMASTNSWDLCVPIFEKAGFKIVCHDFKGQMKSAKPVPESGIYSFKEHAEEAKELFDFLGLKKVNIAGISYGGEVGMKFASLFPEYVQTLTIIDSISEFDEVCKNFVLSWKALCDIGDGETFFWVMAPAIYGPDFLKKERAMLLERGKGFKALDKSYYDGQKILYDTFVQDVYMTDILKNIKCPTLVVCGQNDILKPQKFSEIIYQNIPNCEFAVFPHSGHVPILEQPGILSSIMLGFIIKNL